VLRIAVYRASSLQCSGGKRSRF